MVTKKKSAFVYSEAAAELEEILQDIENGEADIDTLSERVERAAALIRSCREALEGTELRVRKVVDELTTAADDDEDDDADPEG